MIRSGSLIFFLLISPLVFSADNCQWQNQDVALGESVYVQDPILLEMLSDQMRGEGATIKEAKEMAAKSDWVGFVLECVTSFALNKSPIKTGYVITPVGYHLVLVDHQRKWYSALTSK